MGSEVDRDILGEIGSLVREFDRIHGSESAAVLQILKEGIVSTVRIDPSTKYAPAWGKKIHPTFEPPPPGQTRLALGTGRRLIYSKRESAKSNA